MNKTFYPVNGAVRLFDQIKPIDQDARLAFYFALRDTLFVKNPDRLFEVANSGSDKKRVVCYSKVRTLIVKELTGLMSSNMIKRGGFGVTAIHPSEFERQNR